MEDIGLELKNKREENEQSISEVAEDLKVSPADIENLEEGLRERFQDINALKTLISDYAKYLGFDQDKMINRFNEYLFDQTSRISLEDIEKAKQLKTEEEKNKFASPYTIEKKEKHKIIIGLLLVIAILAVFSISYLIVSKMVITDNESEINISYMIGGK